MKRSLRFQRQKKLGVIHEAVKMKVKFPEDMTKWKKVNSEQKGPQDRILGNTSGIWGGVRSECYYLYELSSLRDKSGTC